MPRKPRQNGTRAPNGTSTVYYSQYDGKWHGRVTMGTRDDGKPDRRHIKRAGEADAIRAVRDLEHKRDSGQRSRPGRPWTLETWLTHWFEHIAVPVVRYKTQTYYQTAIGKYLIPGLGAHRLDKLEPEHIERFYARLRREGVNAPTVNQVHKTLRAALNEAARRDRISRNPITVVKAPPMVHTEIEPLTVQDAQAILAAVRTRRNGARWALALALGIRQGEALGLKWSDLSLDAQQTSGGITIRRALQRQTWRHGCAEPCGRKRAAECPHRHGGGLVVVEPKSRAGRRVISLPPPLVSWLLEHRRQQDDDRHTAGDLWRDDGWVFTQLTGRPIDPRADYSDWKALLAEVGVRSARLHDARHTAATMLLVLGVPARAVMDVMGWSQLSMTQRYQHVSDDLRDSIASQLGELLWRG